jgi:hypothetical protein
MAAITALVSKEKSAPIIQRSPVNRNAAQMLTFQCWESSTPRRKRSNEPPAIQRFRLLSFQSTRYEEQTSNESAAMAVKSLSLGLKNIVILANDCSRYGAVRCTSAYRFSCQPGGRGFLPLCLSCHNLAYRTEQAIYFFRRVVVSETDAKEAAVFFNVQLFGEIDRVIVPVPCEKSTIA